jgi:hypothetical protein
VKLASAVLAAVAATTLCMSARAAPPPLGVAPDPQKLALADRYMADVHSERLVRSLLEETLRRTLDAEFRRMNAGIPVYPQ